MWRLLNVMNHGVLHLEMVGYPVRRLVVCESEDEGMVAYSNLDEVTHKLPQERWADLHATALAYRAMTGGVAGFPEQELL